MLMQGSPSGRELTLGLLLGTLTMVFNRGRPNSSSCIPKADSSDEFLHGKPESHKHGVSIWAGRTTSSNRAFILGIDLDGHEQVSFDYQSIQGWIAEFTSDGGCCFWLFTLGLEATNFLTKEGNVTLSFVVSF